MVDPQWGLVDLGEVWLDWQACDEVCCLFRSGRVEGTKNSLARGMNNTVLGPNQTNQFPT